MRFISTNTILSLGLVSALLLGTDAQNLRGNNNNDDKQVKQQDDSNHGNLRKLAPPVSHSWAFGDRQEANAEPAAPPVIEAVPVAITSPAAPAEGIKDTPIGHGWANGEKDVAAPARAEREKGTPIGHGWALENDKAPTAAPAEGDKAATEVAAPAGNDKAPPASHGWSLEGSN